MTDFDTYILNLKCALESNDFAALDIHPPPCSIFESANEVVFDISAELRKIGAGMATYFYRVDLIGKRDDFRRLALILFSQALAGTNQYLKFRLREHETN